MAATEGREESILSAILLMSLASTAAMRSMYSSGRFLSSWARTWNKQFSFEGMEGLSTTSNKHHLSGNILENDGP